MLLVVLFFALLLSSSIATFLSRATVDSLIVRNRDAAARAEALARGGVRLATAMLIEDRAQGTAEGVEMDSQLDLWARAGNFEFQTRTGGTLRLRIEDSGGRLNLNAVMQQDGDGNLAAPEKAEELLRRLLEKVIDEMKLPPEEKSYDASELVANLIDFVDRDTVRQRGGLEDDAYQDQDQPYRAPNRPLISVDELGLVEGFDPALVRALRPYVTVYPFVGGGGINPNTAPPHVLALLFYDDQVSLRLASEDVVRQILAIRKDGERICGEGASFEGCTPIREIVTNAIYPPPTFSTDIFTVTSEASEGEVRRSVEAVVDRSDPAQPRLLSWRVR